MVLLPTLIKLPIGGDSLPVPDQKPIVYIIGWLIIITSLIIFVLSYGELSDVKTVDVRTDVSTTTGMKFNTRITDINKYIEELIIGLKTSSAALPVMLKGLYKEGQCTCTPGCANYSMSFDGSYGVRTVVSSSGSVKLCTVSCVEPLFTFEFPRFNITTTNTGQCMSFTFEVNPQFQGSKTVQPPLDYFVDKTSILVIDNNGQKVIDDDLKSMLLFYVNGKLFELDAYNSMTIDLSIHKNEILSRHSISDDLTVIKMGTITKLSIAFATSGIVLSLMPILMRSCVRDSSRSQENSLELK